MPPFLVSLRRFLSRKQAQQAMCDSAGRRRRYRDKVWTAVELLEDRTLLHGTPAPTNDAPVAQNATVSTPRNEPVSVDLWGLARDNETPDSQLRFEILGDTGGQAVLQQNGHTVVFTPDANFNGNAQFRYKVTDRGDGSAAPKSDTGTVNVNLLSPYKANNDEYWTWEDDTVELDVRDNDSVPYGPSRIVSVTQPQHGDVDIIDHGKELRFNPDDDFNGDTTFNYTIEDDRGVRKTATVTMHVRPVNDAPDARDARYTVPENETFAVDLRTLVSDEETPDNQLRFSVVSDQGGEAVLQSDGYTVIFTPYDDYHGSAKFKYKVTDTGDGSSSPDSEFAEVSFNVVDPYDAHNDTTYVYEDHSVTIDVLRNDSVPFDPARVVRVEQPDNGSVQIVENGKKVRFTPDQNFNGWTSFEYTIRDTRGREQTATSYVYVIPVNDTPMPGTNTGITVGEGGESPITGNELRTTDVDNQPEDLVYTIVSGPAHGQIVVTPADGGPGDGDGGQSSSAFAPTVPGETNPGEPLPITFTQADLNAGRVRYLHDGTEPAGLDGFQYTVSDGDRSISGTFAIRITPVNDPPVIGPSSLTLDEGTTATITCENLKTTDEEQSPDQIVYTVIMPPAHGTIVVDPAVDEGDGDEGDGDEGDGDEGDGDEGDGGPVSSFASFSEAVPGEGGTEEPGGPAPITFTQADINAGRVRYVHDGSETTSDSFTFMVSDGEGGSDQGAFHIDVRPVNDPPTTTRGVGDVFQTDSLSIDLYLLTNDAETPDDLEFEVLTMFGGVAELQDDGHTVIFTPAEDFADEARFTYRVSDHGDAYNGPESAKSAEGDVTIFVNRFQDFGDAPIDYDRGPEGEPLAGGPARHQGQFEGQNVVYLGDRVAYGESGPQSSEGADGDDTDEKDDEDGIAFITGLHASASADGTTVIEVTSHGNGKLDAWIDFNQDGQFSDDEYLFENGSVQLVDGEPNQFVITVPKGTELGTTYARFRVSSEGGLGPTGFAADGEVEDYAVTISDQGDFQFVPAQALMMATQGFTGLPPLGTADPDNPQFQVHDVHSLPADSTEAQINQTMLDLARYYETQRKPGETIIIIAVDPVDFTATDPGGRSAGTVAGTVSNDYGSSAAYSGDGAVELLVIRDATPGQYSMTFAGTGAEFRGGVAAVGPTGTQTAVFTGALGTDDTATLVLDFSAPVADASVAPGEQVAATANNGFFLFNVEDTVNPMTDEEEKQRTPASLEESASTGPGSASEEMRRMFRLSVSSFKSTRVATIDGLSGEGLSDEALETLDQFWMGLGQSILGGIPSQVYHLAEFLGTDLPRLFDPAPQGESAPVKADGAATPAPAAEEGAAVESSDGETKTAQAAGATEEAAPAVAVASVDANRAQERSTKKSAAERRLKP